MSNKIKDKIKGQALVESLFTHVLIFLISFGVIEIARLQSFKALLQTSVNYYAKYLALDEMRLIKKYDFNLNSQKAVHIKSIEDEIGDLIANDLSILKTSLISFENDAVALTKHNIVVSIDFLAQESSRSPPGIHIIAQVCLPVLFSSFFNSFFQNKDIIIGKSVKGIPGERNCLGEYNGSKKNAKFWFKVRAAGYSPWPSSTQIFYRGIGIPEDIRLVDTASRKKVAQKLDEVNFE